MGRDKKGGYLSSCLQLHKNIHIFIHPLIVIQIYNIGLSVFRHDYIQNLTAVSHRQVIFRELTWHNKTNDIPTTITEA